MSHRAAPRQARTFGYEVGAMRIGIVGFGYVGRATAHVFVRDAEVAWHDPAVPGSVALAELARIADLIVVCVPTPIGEGGAVDLRAVESVFREFGETTVRAPVVLRSTVPPGTSQRLAARWPSLRIVYCPEFLRERSATADAEQPARIVLGWTTERIDEVCGVFGRRFPAVPIREMGSTEAELLKLSANALFAVKVSFANEMAELAGRLGASWETIRSALVLDPRVGDGHLAVPGPDGQPGFGGSCLPKDLAGLLALASELETRLDVVEAAALANARRRPVG